MTYQETAKRWGLGAMLLGLGIGFYVTYVTAPPAEDAIMLFDYSRNLATRGIITYGSGSSVPVEGATDFLYMILIAVAAKLGLSEFAAALLLNYLAILLICYLFWRISQSYFLPLIAMLATPFLYATLLGFSPILFSAIYLLSVYLTLRNDRRLYLAILFLCLLRPDGVVWSAGLLAMRLIKLEKPQLASEARYLVMWLIAPGVAYFAWRLWYFGEWLPLPFIVKSSGQRYLGATAAYLLPILIPAVTAVACSTGRLALTRNLMLLYALPVVFYGSMRLEQNYGDRVLAPMFFGVLMLLVSQNSKAEAKLFVFLSACLTWQLTNAVFGEVHYSKNSTARPIALELQKLPRGKLLSTEAGVLAYYSQWAADDSWGLNTPRYAHHLITPSDVARGSYDLIVAHCDINLLATVTQFDWDASSTRTWVHQCEALAAFLHSSGYSIFLVPTLEDQGSSLDYSFVSPDTTCVPHLIYAVSPTYAAEAQVKDILRGLGALEYGRSAGTYVGGDVCRIAANASQLGRLHPTKHDLAVRNGA